MILPSVPMPGPKIRGYTMRTLVIAVALAFIAVGTASAQVGNLIWEDNFNTLDNWLKVQGNGNWGWGNGELEYYKNENVDIAPVPGESGNNALRIIAKAESGPGIVDAWGGALNYTSGKVVSRSFVSVRYGMIETRVLVPNLATGGWPAFWMMGTATATWPTCGELDLMEMGARQAFRDEHDTHNGGNGLNNSTVNQFVGANAIWGSASGTSMIAIDPADTLNRPYYNYANPLAGRFLIYRMYWDSTSMRFTVVDNGVEHDLYTHPFVFPADAEEFHQPFYMLMNLALGGAYTDAYQLGNPASGVAMSMPLPATMYVDYVRIYQYNGQGEVTLGVPTPEHGRFGLYTDNTTTTNALVPGVNANIYVWENTLTAGTIAPYEGANVLTWKTNGAGWFGAGIMSTQPANVFGMGDGYLKFRIKIPANVTFKIGIIDVWGNQNYVSFPANTTTYGLVRNGNWAQASIPATDLRGLYMDLRMLAYEFVILEQNGTGCEFALDDIYWESAVVNAVGPVATAPGTLRMASAPNPFVSATQLRFTLPAAAPYEIGVYDAAGTRMTTFRGIGAQGANLVRWNGRNDQGRAATPGVYFYRLASGGATTSGKVVLVN